MTANELIDELNALPDNVRDMPIEIYLDGTISGFIGIGSIAYEPDGDDTIIAIRSERLMEAG